MSNVPLPEPDEDLQGKEIAPGTYERGYRKDQLRSYAAAVSAEKDKEIAGLRAELLKSLADNAALRERVKLLEDALRHVDDCLSINDYDDYVLLSRFDSDIVSAALEQKP